MIWILPTATGVHIGVALDTFLAQETADLLFKVCPFEVILSF